MTAWPPTLPISVDAFAEMALLKGRNSSDLLSAYADLHAAFSALTRSREMEEQVRQYAKAIREWEHAAVSDVLAEAGVPGYKESLERRQAAAQRLRDLAATPPDAPSALAENVWLKERIVELHLQIQGIQDAQVVRARKIRLHRLERDRALADADRLRGALEEIKRNGSALASRAPVIASAVLANIDPDSDTEVAPNPFGQATCTECGWANHDLRKRCRNCGVILSADTAGGGNGYVFLDTHRGGD